MEQQQTTIDQILAPAPAAQPNPDPGQVAQPAPSQEQGTPPPAADPAVAAPPVHQPEPARTVPLSEHIEERKARQQAQQLAAYYEGQLRALGEAQRQQQQPQPQPIDPVANPEQAYAHVLHAIAERDRQAAIQAQHHQANISEMLAVKEHGAAAVEAARQAAIEQGLGQHFLARRDPYSDLMQWHRSQQLAQEVGNDPAAYRAKIEAEVRAKVLAEMRTGTPPPRNLPPSLATATRANNAAPVVPDSSDFFKGMFDRSRRT
jgi:hypothetical protein